MVNNWSYCSGQGLRAWPGSSARISNANTPTMKNTNGRDHVHRAQPLRVRRAQVTQEPVTARKVHGRERPRDHRLRGYSGHLNPSDHVEDWPGTRPGRRPDGGDSHRDVLPGTLFLRTAFL